MSRGILIKNVLPNILDILNITRYPVIQLSVCPKRPFPIAVSRDKGFRVRKTSKMGLLLAHRQKNSNQLQHRLSGHQVIFKAFSSRKNINGGRMVTLETDQQTDRQSQETSLKHQ